MRGDDLRDKRTPLLNAINYSTVVAVDDTRHSISHRSQSQILVKNHAFLPQLGVPVRILPCWYRKPRIVWLLGDEERLRIWLLVSTEYTNVIDRRTVTDIGRACA